MMDAAMLPRLLSGKKMVLVGYVEFDPEDDEVEEAVEVSAAVVEDVVALLLAAETD